MSGAAGRGRLERAEVVALVREWHGALERHVDVAELRGRLVRSGLLLRLPGATVRDGEQFASWYREVSDSCFDQRRDVLSVEVDLVSPLHAEVTVTLRWESRRWQRPAPRSRWTGCLLTEQWLVVLQDGEPRIRTLVTRTTQPLPGSPPPIGDDDRTASALSLVAGQPAPTPAAGAPARSGAAGQSAALSAPGLPGGALVTDEARTAGTSSADHTGRPRPASDPARPVAGESPTADTAQPDAAGSPAAPQARGELVAS
ncbi:hypothetical protein ABTZ99_43445 [Actinosynnema sp. NPDC002837]